MPPRVATYPNGQDTTLSISFSSHIRLAIIFAFTHQLVCRGIVIRFTRLCDTSRQQKHYVLNASLHLHILGGQMRRLFQLVIILLDRVQIRTLAQNGPNS